MSRFRVSVHVVPRRGLLDPQGKAVLEALRALGWTNVSEARVGKHIEIAVEADDEAAARAQVAESDLSYPLLVDGDGRPLGWLSERALDGERVTEELRSKPQPVIELDDVLRDALSDLLQSETQYGAVVDEQGRLQGILSVELIHDFIAPEAAATTAQA